MQMLCSFKRDDRRWFSGMRLLGLGLLLLTLFASFSGCSGCSKEDPIAKAKRLEEEKAKAEEEKKRKEKEKPKPDFEMVGIEVFPSPFYKLTPDDANLKDPKDRKENKEGKREPLLKSGHWGTGLAYWRANNFDFSGRLRSSYGDGRNPLDIERTNFRLDTLRPAVLTKGQTKALETTFFAPRRSEEDGKLGFFQMEMRAGRSGGVKDERGFNGRSINAHEYFFVVLTSFEGRYEFLRKNDDTFPSMCLREENDLDGELRFYHVQAPSIKSRIPLSEYSLAWTSVACILLDDVDPVLFSTGQQTALLDWLHWGGQVLISGPQSLDRLKGSFLEPYLPATAGDSCKLDAAALAELNEYWSLKAAKNPDRDQPNILVTPDKPIIGVTLEKTEGSDFLPHTGNLVAEKRVGQGRVVVTSFPMADFRIQNWRNYDGFFNGCLLRRPPRDFFISEEQPGRPGFGTFTLGPSFRWQLSSATGTLTRLPEDPRIISTLRYFSRDSGQLDGDKPQKLPPRSNTLPLVLDKDGLPSMTPLNNYEARGRRWWEYDYSDDATAFDEWHFAGAEGQAGAGVAGWNDFSGAANASRDTLRDAAGIRIPTGLFVMQVLAVYLLILVPVNWFVFWMIGRVEWAWACAPIIALLGAFAVIRLAQLDIGFAYSRTEVAILETQGSYDRAHLTRFTTLYTSLSSAYRLDFEDPSAQSLPFSTDPDFQRALGRSIPTCSLEREQQVSLSNIQVQSNSTGTVRSEHMVSVAGGLALTGNEVSGFRLKNGTDFTLKDLGILRRSLQTRQIEAALISELAPGVSKDLSFEPVAENDLAELWKSSEMMYTNTSIFTTPGVVRLGRIVKVALDRMVLLPGEVRLLAWTDDEMPGVSIRPAAPQNQVRTLVLAHLAHAPLPEPKRDWNVYRDIRPEREIFDGTTTDLNATPTSLKTEQGPIAP